MVECVGDCVADDSTDDAVEEWAGEYVDENEGAADGKWAKFGAGVRSSRLSLRGGAIEAEKRIDDDDLEEEYDGKRGERRGGGGDVTYEGAIGGE